ncbi:MAG TPA: ATP-binding protein [Blastocatellia bacterium]
MQIRAIESRVRLAILIFLIALLAAIAVSLTSYLRSASETEAQRMQQTRLEAALLSSLLSSGITDAPAAQMQSYLNRYGITGIAELYSSDGTLLASALTVPSERQFKPLSLKPLPTDSSPQTRSAGPLEQTVARTEGGFDIAEAPAGAGRVLVMASPAREASIPAVSYVLIYQLLALFLGLGVAGLLFRWLLKPYRQVVEAARHSPVHGSPELSESEFVVETFQALITQLQAKERELAQLHSMERRRAERSERFSERLIANIPSGLVTISSAGVVTSANGYASGLFGADEISAEHPGSPGHDGQPLDYRRYFSAAPQLVQLISDSLSSGLYFKREEVDVNASDGRVRRCGLSISPMTDSAQQVEGALCLLTDITEVTELRERMKMQENLANLGEMAAGLAHEFKNSLAAIQGYVQLLDLQSRNPNGSVRTRETHEAVLGEVRLLSQLVTDFLNFARPQRLNLAPVDLGDVVADSVNELRGEISQREIEVKIEGDFPTLQGDELMLRRAFSNLIRNAAEAISDSSIDRDIVVTGTVDRSGPKYAHVRIADTGGGIPGENLQQVFIPFFTTKSRGYGIGLALVQKIIIAHGGSVSVEKSDVSGTTFHCRLPQSPVFIDGQSQSESVQ